ncbi:hypothetical protein CDCA_CDCA05G1462 [Cyanidium caldarium]|uniref:Uncharacterized protein n=1 Tax=Cyanidium caldarium TaxID=2771 RepID=A0AAV9ISY3_CYACA|nr:hypothetical protein CDCA_CDCA05G1462 [Cyanidium caldarium]
MSALSSVRHGGTMDVERGMATESLPVSRSSQSGRRARLGARRGLAWGAARLVLVVTAIALFTWGMLYVGNQLTMPSITDASAQSGTAATDAGDAAYRRAVSVSAAEAARVERGVLYAPSR